MLMVSKMIAPGLNGFAFTFCGKAQTDNKIVIGTVDSIQSKILNEKRKIWVYVPPNDGTSEKYEKQRYPVVYLTDGDYHFITVVSMIQQLHPSWGNPFCPNMIVVGILNTDRTRDLTPTHAVYIPEDSTSGKLRLAVQRVTSSFSARGDVP